MERFHLSPAARKGAVIGLTVVAAVVLIYTLKVPGLVIALLLALNMWLISYYRPESAELSALRSSISLSADDIRDVMAEFKNFETSQDPDVLADRTLHRPALLDLDSCSAEIEEFHYHYASAGRFLKRLPARMTNPMLTTAQLEHLLLITDQRAATLKESWLAARRAAKNLGTDY